MTINVNENALNNQCRLIIVISNIRRVTHQRFSWMALG